MGNAECDLIYSLAVPCGKMHRLWHCNRPLWQHDVVWKLTLWLTWQSWRPRLPRRAQTVLVARLRLQHGVLRCFANQHKLHVRRPDSWIMFSGITTTSSHLSLNAVSRL